MPQRRSGRGNRINPGEVYGRPPVDDRALLPAKRTGDRRCARCRIGYGVNPVIEAPLGMYLMALVYDGQMTFGEAIKHVRECCKLSLRDFGVLCGVAKNTAWMWEQDRVAPNLGTFLALCRGLDALCDAE